MANKNKNMKIYNHLFYSAYELALRSINHRPYPYMLGICLVSGCIGFNLITIIGFFMKVFDYDTDLIFFKNFKYIFGIPAIFLISIYYLYNNRHKKIYDAIRKTKKRPRQAIDAWGTVLLYYLVSLVLLIVVSRF